MQKQRLHPENAPFCVIFIFLLHYGHNVNILKYENKNFLLLNKILGDNTMIAELRQKAQITIPKEIIVKLGLSEGDKLDIFEKDGFICIMPVAVYPKKYLDELREEISDVKAKIASGEQPVFDSVDALFDKLEAK